MIFVLNSFLTHLTLDHVHDIVVQIDGEILDTVNFATNKIDPKKNYTFFDLEKYRISTVRTDITR
jgi:hypothetical protein